MKNENTVKVAGIVPNMQLKVPSEDERSSCGQMYHTE